MGEHIQRPRGLLQSPRRLFMGVLGSHMLPCVVHGLVQGYVVSHTGDKTDIEEGAFNFVTLDAH